MKVFEAIPELLRRQQVGHVFAMLGGTNVNWVADGVGKGAFELVNTRHEETAVHAATGYSRATGRVGVCTVTRGPGFMNTLNGLFAASFNHVPLLLIVGQSPVSNTRTEYTSHNVPQEELTALTGAGFQHVATAAELEPAFWQAIRDTTWNGRPQVLSVNNGFMRDDIVLSDDGPSLRREAPDAESVELVVNAIERSRRPLILAGQGALVADAHDELVELADLIGARVTTSLAAHRFFAGHPHDLGLSGTWSVPAVRDVMADSDLVIAFGASLNPRTTYYDRMFGDAPVVHCEVDIDQPFMASSPDLALLGDARLAAQALIDTWKGRGLDARPVEGKPSPTVADQKASVLAVELDHDPERGLDVRHVVAAINEKLPENRIVVTDSGRTVGVTVSLVDAPDARSWLVGNSYGCVGRGIGTAVGAAIANPGRRTVLICGDGGFMMGLSGLDVARLHALDLTVVILNDRQLGSEVKYLRQLGQPLDVIRQEMPGIPDLANVYGGVGTVLETEQDLKELELVSEGLHIVDARLDPLVNGVSALA